MAAGRDQAARAVRDEAPAPPQAPQSPPSQPSAPIEPTPADAAPVQTGKSGGRRRKILFGVVALVALGAIAYGVNYFLVGRYFLTTDDAYVRANNTTLGARVAGHINAIVVADNAKVHAGDVIVRIDDGDYRIAVELGPRAHRYAAGDDRADRPADRGAGERRRSGEGAARLGQGRRGSGAG